MADTCAYLGAVRVLTSSTERCEDCLKVCGHWVHLRLCMYRGQVECRDSSPDCHATAHWRVHPLRPLIRSLELGRTSGGAIRTRSSSRWTAPRPAPSQPQRSGRR